MKPGITGMWQISGRSSITDFDEVVKLDREYIENWNFGKATEDTVEDRRSGAEEGRSSVRESEKSVCESA